MDNLFTPKAEAVRARLSQGAANAPELLRATGLSQPSLSRLLRALRPEILPIGAARARRYGLLRAVRDLQSEIPVYRVGARGRDRRIGSLFSLAAGQFWFESATGDRAATRLYPDLPWWLQDLRPQGFLGRLFAAAHPELHLPTDPRAWSADAVLHTLTRLSELPGDLLLGTHALEDWKKDLAWTGEFAGDLRASERMSRYPRCASYVTQGRAVGSSAGGEQPKFGARVLEGENSRFVIVKFSPLETAPLGQRWADLLLAEHHALQVLTESGIPCARSQIIQSEARSFLEVERFDRVGAHGRRGVVSIGVADAEFTGAGPEWVAAARALQAEKRLSLADRKRIERVSAFGQLIGNTDMHGGNLSLFHDDAQRPGYGQFLLAPVYDMLPMLYAPRAGEVITPAFTFPMTGAGMESALADMRPWALELWARVAAEARVSPGFREIAAANRAVLAGA